MSEKSEKKILQEINEKMSLVLAVLISKEENTDKKIKLLCGMGLKSEEIGKLVGMTGRGVRKNKSYKE